MPRSSLTGTAHGLLGNSARAATGEIDGVRPRHLQTAVYTLIQGEKMDRSDTYTSLLFAFPETGSWWAC